MEQEQEQVKKVFIDLDNDIKKFLEKQDVVAKILDLAEKRFYEDNKDVVDLTKNYGIDLILARYYKTYKLTEDTDNIVNEKQNNYIRNKYLFKAFKQALKDYELYYKGYIRSQESVNGSYYYKVKNNKWYMLVWNWFKNLFKRKKKQC